MRYDAFISYSHAADGALAPAIQRGLQRFAKPWYRLRAARIFRDQSSLAVNPGLWPSIADALDQSRFFVLLASPQAARSEWVCRELSYWLDARSTEQMLIVLTDGELIWDAARNDFHPELSSALPDVLKGRFADEPLHLDLRWAKRSDQLDTGNPLFDDAIADLAAPLHGIAKDELIGEDVRAHRTTMRVAWGAVASLTVLLILVAVAAGVAWWQRDLALEREQAALARELVLRAQRVRLERPQEVGLSALLAVEAARRLDSLDTAQALHDALRMLPSPPVDLSDGGWGDAVGFSADGRDVVIVAGGQVSIFDATSGRLRHRLHAPRTSELALSAGGRYVAAASEDGESERIWRLSDAAPASRPLEVDGVSSMSSVRAHPRGTLAFSPDGRWLVNARRLLRTDSTHDARELPIAGKVRAVAFSNDSRYLALATQSGIALVWELASATTLHALAHADAVTDLDFSPDGASLVTASHRLITVWSLKSGRARLAMSANDSVEGVAFSPDGQRIASAQFDNSAQVLDAASGSRVHLLAHDRPVNSVAFSADGRLLVTSSYDRTARLWRVDSGEEVWRGVDEDYIVSAAVAPDRTRVLTSGITGTRVWPLIRGAEVARVHHPGAADLAVDPGGRWLAIAGSRPRGAGSLTIWDLHARRVRFDATLPAAVRHLAFDASGDRLAVAGHDGTVRVWNARDGRSSAFAAHHRAYFQPTRVGFDASGALLAATSYDLHPAVSLHRCARDRAIVEPLSRGCELHDVRAGLGSKQIMAFLDGAERVVLRQPAESGHNAVALDVASGEQLLRIPYAPAAVAFDPGSELLASADDGRFTASLWRIGAREPVAALAHASYVGLVAFSPDGRYLAAASSDPMTSKDYVAVWEVRTRRERARLSYPEGVSQVAFTHDGAHLLVVTGDHVVTAEWRSEQLLERVCARLGRNLSEQEWRIHLRDAPYRRSCANLP